MSKDNAAAQTDANPYADPAEPAKLNGMFFLFAFQCGNP